MLLSKTDIRRIGLALAGLTVLLAVLVGGRYLIAPILIRAISGQSNYTAQLVPFLFTDEFEGAVAVGETWKMEESESPYWWVSSGAEFKVQDGIGMTLQGKLPISSKWRLLYLYMNPRDTDDGYRPQNTFRLVNRGTWGDLYQEAYFLVNRDNLSPSYYRNAWNGLLFFNRYQDQNNLYYTGIRVDGAAVIKKKIEGVYYTMAYEKIFPGANYDRQSNPSLIPKDKWIGLKSEVKTRGDGVVEVALFVDYDRSGKWERVLVALDDGTLYGGGPLLSEGHAGLRTDFMDVYFDDYKIGPLDELGERG